MAELVCIQPFQEHHHHEIKILSFLNPIAHRRGNGLKVTGGGESPPHLGHLDIKWGQNVSQMYYG